MGSRSRDSELCRHVLHAAGAGMWDWDVVNDVLTADEHCHRLLGSAVRTHVFRPAIEASGEFNYDRRLPEHDGFSRWIRLCGCALGDETGHVVRCIGVMRDVTAEHQLRESEERLSFVLSATHDGVWDVDVTTRRVWWSDGMLCMLGLVRERSPRDLDAALALVHPDDRPTAFGGLENGRTAAPAVQRRLVRMRHAEGGWRAVESWSVVELDAETGHPRRIAGIVHDRTEEAGQAGTPATLAVTLNSAVLARIDAATRHVKTAALALPSSPARAGEEIESSAAQLERARDGVEELIQAELLRARRGGQNRPLH